MKMIFFMKACSLYGLRAMRLLLAVTRGDLMNRQGNVLRTGGGNPNVVQVGKPCHLGCVCGLVCRLFRIELGLLVRVKLAERIDLVCRS
jgi:hypothetical protein